MSVDNKPSFLPNELPNSESEPKLAGEAQSRENELPGASGSFDTSGPPKARGPAACSLRHAHAALVDRFRAAVVSSASPKRTLTQTSGSPRELPRMRRYG